MAQQATDRSRGWVWVLVAIAACFGLFFFIRSRHEAVEVRSAKVERHDLARTNSTNGRVIPLDDFQAHAPAPGEVEKIFVRLGENVSTSQELLNMSDTGAHRDLATAEATLSSSMDALQAMKQGGTQDERLSESANLTAAHAQVQQDTSALAALTKLETQGAASANEITAAQERLTAAQAKVLQLQQRQHGRYSSGDLSAQRAQVAEAQAAVQAARSAYAAVDIHAPFSGTVYALPVRQYQFVQAGETLIQVADLTKLQIMAYFDEPEIGLLKDGQPVTIVWDAKPGQVWHGHILQAPTTIIPYGGTRNVGECLISVDDAKGDLLPNTTVTVTVTELRRNDVLSLPREALHTEGMNDFVYRIVDGHLARTPVTVGVTNLTRFEVLGGLNEGALVALGATTEADLSDGLRVKVQP